MSENGLQATLTIPVRQARDAHLKADSDGAVGAFAELQAHPHVSVLGHAAAPVQRSACARIGCLCAVRCAQAASACLCFLVVVALVGALDSCASVECGQHGSCESGVCACQPGYGGTPCTVDVCYQVSDCGAHGYCHISCSTCQPPVHECLCAGGWKGFFCDEIDPCFQQECSGNGHCNEWNGHCSCDDGFSGEQCELNCASEMANCSNHGRATVSSDREGCECTCDDAFTGEQCELNCASEMANCSNHGRATVSCDREGCECTCDDAFAGEQCELNCASEMANCSNHGRATVSSDREGCECSCDDAFVGEQCNSCVAGLAGAACETDIDECASSPCKNGATCVESSADPTVPLDSYTCVCPAGLTGAACEIDIDECASNPCIYRGSCFESSVDPTVPVGNYTCVLTGFALIESHIEGVTTAGLALVEANLPRELQESSWALCYDSSIDCTTCPSKAYIASWNTSLHCSCPSGSTSFHGGCDAHNKTIVIGHNSLNFTFGGFAQTSWDEDIYYHLPRTWAGREDATNFLFRLGPGVNPMIYHYTGYMERDIREGASVLNTAYQQSFVSFWPNWGALSFGICGELGNGELGGDCRGGNFYEGRANDVCGGAQNWGATEMEVWYRVGS